MYKIGVMDMLRGIVSCVIGGGRIPMSNDGEQGIGCEERLVQIPKKYCRAWQDVPS